MKHLLTVIRMICRFQRGYAWRLAAASLVTGAAPLVNIILPRRMIDELLGGRDIRRLILLAALLALGNLAAMLLDRMLTNRLTTMTTLAYAHMQQIVSEKALRIPLADSESKRVLDLGERVHFGIYSLHNLDATVKKLGGSAVSLLSVIAIVLSGSPVLALLILALNLPSLYCLKKLKHLDADNVERSASEERAFKYYASLSIDYRYSKDLKLYDGLSLMMTRAEKNMQQILRVNHQYFTKSGFWLGIIGSLVEIQSVVVFAFLGIRLLLSRLTVGAFTMLYGASRQMGRALNNLMDSANELMTSDMYLKPLVEYLNLPEQQDIRQDSAEGRTPPGTDHERRSGAPAPAVPFFAAEGDDDVQKCVREAFKGHLEWEVKDLSFRYPSGHVFVLDHCSLRIHSGERVALVGTNGAGKSTLVKLLCRYYEQQEGVITLNGVDIRRIPLELYGALLSPTFQDYHLFPFRMIENVAAVEAENMSEDKRDKAIHALDKLGLTAWVRSLKHGVHTHHSETLAEDGVLPSGGEGQKLALARSLAHAGPFVIMDEPTAALDPRSEEEIFRQMLALSEQKTSLFISHRLSSTRYADRILVIENGHVIEEGSHAELIALSGLYAAMYRAQASQYT